VDGVKVFGDGGEFKGLDCSPEEVLGSKAIDFGGSCGDKSDWHGEANCGWVSATGGSFGFRIFCEINKKWKLYYVFLK